MCIACMLSAHRGALELELKIVVRCQQMLLTVKPYCQPFSCLLIIGANIGTFKEDIGLDMMKNTLLKLPGFKVSS